MAELKRINNPTSIDNELIEYWVKNKEQVIISFWEYPLNEDILSQVNELCNKHDENLCVSFGEGYTGLRDFGELLKVSNVKCLDVNTLISPQNINALGELKHLKKLSFGVYKNKDPEILGLNNFKNLNELVLHIAPQKSLNLQYLKNYKNLKSLRIEGNGKNFEAIGFLDNLENLTLRSVKKVPVDFINNLKKLKTLEFTLGSRENINEISENNIEKLEIYQVRGFNDFSNIGSFRNLKSLLVAYEPHLNHVNFDSEFSQLEDLRLVICKNLSEIKGIVNLTKINEFRIAGTSIDFDKFINQEFPKTLKILAFNTLKIKRDKEIKAELEKLGYSD